MVKMKGILLAWGAIFCFFVPSSRGIAGNIHVGSLGIHPYVSVSAGYTDNVFLTQTAETSDTFYLISPGIKLILPIKRQTFNLDYTVDHYIYRERDEADRTVHNATGTLDLNPWESLNIQISDKFTRSEDAPDFEGDRTSPFIWNSSGVDAEYDISSRLALGGGYEYRIKRYDRSIDRIDDYNEDGLSGRLYIRILPKTSLMMLYQYQARDYEERGIENNHSNRLEGGVTWKIGANSMGTVRVGYMQTDYHRIDQTDDTLSYFISLTHQFGPKTTLSLEGVREILDSTRADDNLAFSNSYVSTQIAATLSHCYRKLTGRLRVGYIGDTYLHDDIGAGTKRRDSLLRTEFGIDYALQRWLNLGGSYRYSRLNSNFRTEEYEESIFLVHLSLVL